MILPELFERACVIGVVTYNRYSISANRISPELAKNSSQVVELLLRVIRGIQFSQREGKNACVTLPTKRNVYYPFGGIIELLRDWVLCYLTMSGVVIPEYLEEGLQLIQAGLNKIGNQSRKEALQLSGINVENS